MEKTFFRNSWETEKNQRRQEYSEANFEVQQPQQKRKPKELILYTQVNPQSPKSQSMNGSLKELKTPATPNIFKRDNLPEIAKRGRPTGQSVAISLGQTKEYFEKYIYPKEQGHNRNHFILDYKGVNESSEYQDFFKQFEDNQKNLSPSNAKSVFDNHHPPESNYLFRKIHSRIIHQVGFDQDKKAKFTPQNFEPETYKINQNQVLNSLQKIGVIANKDLLKTLQKLPSSSQQEVLEKLGKDNLKTLPMDITSPTRFAGNNSEKTKEVLQGSSWVKNYSEQDRFATTNNVLYPQYTRNIYMIKRPKLIDTMHVKYKGYNTQKLIL